MRLHYSSSVDVCQPIRPIPTFVAAGISQFSCTRPGQYGLPVLGFAKPQFSTFVCEDLKSSDRFLLPDFVTDKFYKRRSAPYQSGARFDADLVINRLFEPLLATKILFCGLNRNMPQKELNLLQFAASTVT
jgi:hypothetical protein